MTKTINHGENVNKFIKSILLNVICFFTFINANAELPEYKNIDLGVQETDSSGAIYINNNNEILGKYWLQGEQHIFIWSLENGMRLIDFPKDAHVIKMNAQRQIIGHIKNKEKSTQFLSYEDFFVWDEVNGITYIALNDCDISIIKDINDDGLIIGVFSKDKTYGSFIWENGQIKILDHLYGELGIAANMNIASSINNEGDIVGHSSKTLFHKGKAYKTQHLAVIWKASNNWEVSEIFPYDEFLDSRALKINDSGHILCEKSDKGSVLFDIKENRIIHFNNNPIIKNLTSKKYLNLNNKHTNQGLGLYHYEIKPSGEAQNGILKFDNFNVGIWKGVEGIASVNNSFWAVGVGINVYGEHHAILLVPVWK